jgi:hypothetical protein
VLEELTETDYGCYCDVGEDAAGAFRCCESTWMKERRKKYRKIDGDEDG